MMRVRKLPVSALLISVALTLAICCSSLDPFSSFAGGSGAGNPGGTVAFSMHAGIESRAGDSLSDHLGAIGIADSGKPITVTDKAGLKICISNVSLANISVLFSLDSSETPSKLLTSMKHHSPELSTDTHSFALSGPYHYNALEENNDSSVRMLRLPIARYTGVGLHFNRDSSSTLPGQIMMKGTFSYKGVERKLIVDLSNSSWAPYRSFYRFKGGIFTLSHSDTTNLRLRFMAGQWFSDIDFAFLLNKGFLFFNDSTGILHITNRPPHGASMWYANRIFDKFMEMGSLVVY